MGTFDACLVFFPLLIADPLLQVFDKSENALIKSLLLEIVLVIGVRVTDLHGNGSEETHATVDLLEEANRYVASENVHFAEGDVARKHQTPERGVVEECVL